MNKGFAPNSCGLYAQIRQSTPVRIDATLHCKNGEMLALVGPSGSGKSTVLRSIAGLHRVDQARIECAGEQWNNPDKSYHLKTQQRKVGLVFQEYALFPHKSALENVVLATPGTSRKQRRRKAAELLERTNMTGLESRMPATLSGGQKQRVALARALAREPKVLLLDEPFSAVDQQTRRKLYSELAALRQSLDLPIILVTHDLTEVQLLADSLCLMYRGASLQQGQVADVINRPKSRVIARLVGHQNLFNATIVAHEAQHSLYQIGEIPPVKGPRLDGIELGSKASLLFAPSAIRMMLSNPESQAGAYTNNEYTLQLKGCVHECIILGDELSIRLHLDHVPKSLRFKLPMHVAREAAVVKGREMTVSIQYSGIHAMAD